MFEDPCCYLGENFSVESLLGTPCKVFLRSCGLIQPHNTTCDLCHREPEDLEHCIFSRKLEVWMTLKMTHLASICFDSLQNLIEVLSSLMHLTTRKLSSVTLVGLYGIAGMALLSKERSINLPI